MGISMQCCAPVAAAADQKGHRHSQSTPKVSRADEKESAQEFEQQPRWKKSCELFWNCWLWPFL